MFLSLMPVTTGLAQNPASVLDGLDIEIWPDYDKASVLVLLTGMLPADSRFPAAVTLPLPEAAQLNAVARIDPKDGNMKDDIVRRINPDGTLTFITPELRFRVEYYLPYVVDKSRRSFEYTWLTDIAVNNLQLRVQRPASASALNTEPAAAQVVRGADGFDYHIFPAQAVPAGKPFALRVNYEMITTQLSALSVSRPNAGNQTSAIPAAPNTGFRFKWAWAAIVAGGLILFAALVWQIASRRPVPNNRRPIDSQMDKQSSARFCRNCGEPIEAGDRFCSSCGSEI
jgi:hypothetical protein